MSSLYSVLHYQLHPSGSFLCLTNATGYYPHCHLYCEEMSGALKLFTILSCKIDCQALRIHWQIFVTVVLLRQFFSIILCVYCTHFLIEHWICTLNGQLIMTSSSCNILVMPAGMVTRWHFCHRNQTFTVLWSGFRSCAKWAWTAFITVHLVSKPIHIWYSHQLDLPSSSHLPGPIL